MAENLSGCLIFSGTKGTSYQTQQYLGYGAPHDASAPPPYATGLPPPSLVRAAPQAAPPPPPPMQTASTYYSQSAGNRNYINIHIIDTHSI